tara:strand:+ start:1319 stop:2239 length:921 start_codon:yes stop_codon:yes gene_type:complete
MKKLVIAGGSGFLGEVLIEYFKNTVDHIYILTRSKMADKENVSFVKWDAVNLGNWKNCLNDVDVLINLTGKSVDCRYDTYNKKAILSSRLESTRVLGEAIKTLNKPPKTWINSSTATIYRHSLDVEMDEFSGEIGEGFSVEVAKAWEKEFFSFSFSQTRQVALRTSIVFGKNGGALQPIKKLTMLGFGGAQGNGDQKVSWIHELDFARAVSHIIDNILISGPINIVSPKPTTNRILMKTIRKQLNIPFGIPMGERILNIGARLINTETELILKSRNVIPKKLTDSGFNFEFKTLDSAIANLLEKSK